MVLANPPLAEPVTDSGGVINKPPFEMGVANFELGDIITHDIPQIMSTKRFYFLNIMFRELYTNYTEL